MNTLIAIADKIFSVKLESELSKECRNVDCVNSALEMHHYINKNDYDILIIDSELPDLDGFQIVQRIDQEESNTKIILLDVNGQGKKLGYDYSDSILVLNNVDCRQGLITKLKEEKILN